MPETIVLDPELAARADALFRELGLDLSTAIQLFLKQSLREHGLPFTPRLTPPAPRPAEDASPAPEGGRTVSWQESPEACPGEDQEPAEKPVRAAEDDTDTAEAPLARESAPVADHEKEREDDAGEENAPVRQEGGEPEQVPETSDGRVAGQDGGELRQAFLNAHLIGAPLRRVRSLNRLYSIGEPNDHVQGWREVYVSGDEPFALDFGMVRVELGFHGGGSLRMMDGRLPDEVLEADAVYPRDLSAVFSSVIGQRLADVTSSRIWNEGREREQLCLRFANGCTLNFAPGGEWGALWLTDAHGAVMFAPEAVWLRVLDDRTRNGLR